MTAADFPMTFKSERDSQLELNDTQLGLGEQSTGFSDIFALDESPQSVMASTPFSTAPTSNAKSPKRNSEPKSNLGCSFAEMLMKFAGCRIVRSCCEEAVQTAGASSEKHAGAINEQTASQYSVLVE